MKEDVSLEELEELEPKPRGRRVWRVLFGLALAGLLGVILGSGAYYGIPFLYREVVDPIQSNFEKIDELEQRIAVLEETQDAIARGIETQAEIDEETHSSIGQRLDRLREAFTNLSERVESQSHKVDVILGMQRDLTGMRGELQALSRSVDRISAEKEGDDLSEQSIVIELTILESMLFLVRARLWLVEDNLGLAIVETQNARTTLEELSLLEVDGLDVSPVVERLDMALADMESSPLVAADDLEIAWKMLQGAIVGDSSTE